MQLHGNTFDNTEPVLVIEELQNKLTYRSDFPIRMLEAMLEHFLNLIEGVLWPLAYRTIFNPLIDN